MSEVKNTKDLDLAPEVLKTSIKGILDHVVDLTVEVIMRGKGSRKEEKTNENDASKDKK